MINPSKNLQRLVFSLAVISLLSPLSASAITKPSGPGKISRSKDLPKVLSIPKLGVSANIELIGVQLNGVMEAPRLPNDVGWYHYGYKPGLPGNALIAGHLNTFGGTAIFRNLRVLRAGDTMTVTDSTKVVHTFRVTKVAIYPWSKVPLDSVMGPSAKAHLNLFTCTGVWNRVQRNYSHRLVVYTEAI